MRILVTGGAGYIGSISTRFLLDTGYEVVVLDTLERGHRAAVDGRAEFVQADVGDVAVLAETLPGCDAVLHCAGYIEVAESQAQPERYFENNDVRPARLLEAMRAARVGNLVFSSTAAVYGEPEAIPIPEEALTMPVNAYGLSKLAFERRIIDAETEGWLSAVRLRYFNVAGAWPDGTLGEAHEPETHIIPRILARLQVGDDSFEVFGNDYPTEDGTCVRDYIHVADLAEAHALALQQAVSGRGGSVCNLGSMRGYSNLEVVRTCADVVGREVNVTFGPRRAGDPARLVASNGRARSELGWRPRRQLREMIADAWRWHDAHPDGYRLL